jgi:hypothetical protein
MMFLHNRYTFFLYDVSRSSTQWYASLYHLHRGNSEQGARSSFNVLILLYSIFNHILCTIIYVSIAFSMPVNYHSHLTNFYLKA